MKSIFIICLCLLFATTSYAQRNNAPIHVPIGFTATVVQDKLGNIRDIAFANHTLYVKLGALAKGKGIYSFATTGKNFKLRQIESFGDYTGTGICVYKGYLYTSSDDAVYRYKIKNEGTVNGTPEIVVSGLTNEKEHAAKSFTIDENDNLYVNIGAPSNSCQEKDRTQGSIGMQPCPILEYAGGIWQFSASLLNQKQTDGIRFATGIRNAVALTWDTQSKQLFVVQHGRDQLHDNFPQYFSVEQNAALPAEEFLAVHKNDNFGWPYCYYDGAQNKKILAPEYGGDGKKVGQCVAIKLPIATFPAHWAPNGLMFYHGNVFPEKYKHGAFIVFHGSWNRAPLLQSGYCVVFVPFKNGVPNSSWEVFASGFNSDINHYRPMGITEATDGSIYVSETEEGRIWRIGYKK